jgi:hypothetical protein
MKTRFFAFGCSLTNHNWPTWADLVGMNFDEYYNHGRGGAANNFILDRFLRADLVYNFNPETDVVAVMLTGINRFSWVNIKTDWYTNGDIEHILEQPDNPSYPMLKNFVKDMWNPAWATHNIHLTATTIKSLLSRRGVKNFIFKGIEFDHFITESEFYNLSKGSVDALNETQDIVEYPIALQTYLEGLKSPSIEFNENGKKINDGHPHPKHHYEYTKMVLPEYVNDKVIEQFNYMSEGIYDGGSSDAFKKSFDAKLKEIGKRKS